MINAEQRRRSTLLHTRTIRRDADIGNRADDRASDARSPPLDAIRITESEEKEGGTQTRDQWSPLLVRGSLINELPAERDCVVGEVAMFFATSNFTAANRAALFAARVAVGAVVRSRDGGIWGVSDPLCHPPITVPRPIFGGRSVPFDQRIRLKDCALW
jgi:hypothetical protein